MAIIPESQYPGKITPASAEYPYGQARNITLPGDGTGTPWEAALVNDLFGFQQALLTQASIVPTGDPEEVGASQYLEALQRLGVFLYDSARGYNTGETVRTDAAVYRSLVDNNTGNDPDADDGTNWEKAPTREEIDTRTLYAASFTDLEAIPGPLVGQIADVEGGQFKYNGTDWVPLIRVNVESFGVKGDSNSVGSTGTENSDAIQAVLDRYGVFGQQSDQPYVRDTAPQYEIYFPRGWYLIDKTVYVDYHNLDIVMDGVLVMDGFDGVALDFDYTRSRRPGTTEALGAAAYKRNHRVSVARGSRQWPTVNPSPKKYDRLVLTFSGATSEGDTLTLNNRVYTFTTTPSGDTEILIGATASDTIDNVIAALDADPESLVGTTKQSTSVLVIDHGASPESSESSSADISDDKFEIRDTGVLIGNMWDSDLALPIIANFTLAWEMLASSDTGSFGMETNRIRQGRIENNQISCRLRQVNGSYNHDNTFYSGNWRVAQGTATSHYGCIVDNIRATNNVWFHVDHEPTTPDDPEVQETPTFLFMGNVFRNRTLYSRGERASINARIEKGEIDPVALPNTNEGPYQNVFVSGFDNAGIVDRSATKQNYTNKANRSARLNLSQEIASLWNVPLLPKPNMYDYALDIDGSERQIAGFSILDTGVAGNNYLRRSGGVTIALPTQVVRWASGTAVGVVFKGLRGDEEFLSTANSPTDKAGRPYIRVFDSSGVDITESRSVLGEAGASGTKFALRYSSNGWTTQGVDQESGYQRIKLNNPDIAEMFVGWRGGTDLCEIDTMQVYSLQDAPNVRVVSGTEPDDTFVLYSNSINMSGPARKPGVFVYDEASVVNGSGNIRLGFRRKTDDSGWEEIWAATSGV